ncbi:MAG: hypothetical protein IKQ60_08775 [Candidatus Methanomethylophilaceae archaeon]|nr:hypothetical protein [Candidatus Methanomethylophilaceae archaeon]
MAGVLNLFSKDLLNAGMGPMEICACREGITAVVFGLALLLLDRRAFRIRVRDVPLFLLFGAFNVYPTSACSPRRRAFRWRLRPCWR